MIAMAENFKTSGRVGASRRVIGLCLFALGILVTARDVWLGLFNWSEFRAEDRIRFVFWLWAGAMVTSAGCWLAFRLRAAAWALVIVALSFGVVAYSYGRWWR
jgi:hypothetical protein